ncbi:conserved hypothetical protein [Micromonospora sp. ATCC 39149]|uniref:DUF5666 domain-containing protein n=1 Tax=Micromonospora carbonacea TaxID=47853 RepID=A0A7D6CBB6_9ACTN|nr:conserved hypothetical protein [Micromonospora sp. ATCC 39149]QLJ96905.1 hypothetical protein HZU44_18670 [Micromonospora carbonacea]
MRRASIVLTAVGLLVLMTACSLGGDPGPRPAVPATGPPPPSKAPTIEPPPAGGSGVAPPTNPGGLAGRPSPRRTGSPLPPSGGDIPGGLPWGGRTLTGAVERSGGCTTLLVGTRRWALTGEAAEALNPGDRVTVHGALVPRPAACADRDLAQTVAVARVDPA